MEDSFNALDIIVQTRGKVVMDETRTGENLFLVWGWSSAVFFLLAFILWQKTGVDWCQFLWAGIPLVGTPLMIRQNRNDRARTHTRTHGSKVVLDYWIFAGMACFIGGFIMGFAGLDKVCLYPITALLVGIGSFLTGEVLRFRPMLVCGLIGAAVSIGAFLFQGELWPWQLFSVSLVAAVSMIVPGYLYRRVRNGV